MRAALGRGLLLSPIVCESGALTACIFHEFEGRGTSFFTGDLLYDPT
jgi:hypothetical protein